METTQVRKSRVTRRMGGHILAETLVAQGIDHVFAVPGESYLDVLDGLYDVHKSLKLVTCRFEAGAVNMAEAYGKITGRPAAALPAPSNWYVVDRVWKNGDTLSMTIPMSLHVHSMPDDRTMQAIMYGPLVLAGRLGTDGITAENLRAGPTPPREVPEYKDQKTMVVPDAFTSGAAIERNPISSSWSTSAQC